MHLLEAKASKTAKPEMVIPMRKLSKAWKSHFGEKRAVTSTLVHRPARATVASKAIAEDVQVISWKEIATRFEV